MTGTCTRTPKLNLKLKPLKGNLKPSKEPQQVQGTLIGILKYPYTIPERNPLKKPQSTLIVSLIGAAQPRNWRLSGTLSLIIAGLCWSQDKKATAASTGSQKGFFKALLLGFPDIYHGSMVEGVGLRVLGVGDALDLKSWNHESPSLGASRLSE